MIYLVSIRTDLVSDKFARMTVEESIARIEKWDRVQVDSEETGRDAHTCDVLSLQLGNDADDCRIVIDTETVDIRLYKKVLEEKLLILQNAKFDLQFFYNYGIIPMKVYDTMVVEQLIYLGYPQFGKIGGISYSLHSIAERRLGINIDKTVRGEIIWRGLDEAVVLYGAGDVTYLEKIMESQIEDLRKQKLLRAASIENRFVPVIAYLEWCGIYLNPEKWKAKMASDQKSLEESEKALDDFVIRTPELEKFTEVNMQGDLFSGFDTTPKCKIKWSSQMQVVKVAKTLGFNTTIQDKDTGEDKDSVIEKLLMSQKGINDEFLKLYFAYQGFFKVVSSFGQGHLNAINPNTGRIHTTYKQMGAASGRMSCGSQAQNNDLAKLLGISPKDCTYPNIQQLPADDATRGAFTNQYPDTLICSADFSALESRLGADIYGEKAMIEEFLYGSGDMHSLMAIVFFGDQMEPGITTKEVKEKHPDLRKNAKSPEFLIQFGGSAYGLAIQLGIPLELAQSYIDKYYASFNGIAKFKERGEKFVLDNGYVLMCKYSGHRMHWWDHDAWVQRAKSYTPEFWDEYKTHHKGTGDKVAEEVSRHFRAKSKWGRMALNAPTQGSGIVILKIAMRMFFEWVVENGLFNVVKLCALVHDEAVIEYPKSVPEAPAMLKKCMEDAAALVCTSLPIPSVPECGDHWIH